MNICVTRSRRCGTSFHPWLKIYPWRVTHETPAVDMGLAFIFSSNGLHPFSLPLVHTWFITTQVAALESALKAEQHRAADYYSQLAQASMSSRSVGASTMSPFKSPGGPGKKSDDMPGAGGLPGAPSGSGLGAYDPESAVLQGASGGTFLPLAGRLRGRGGVLAAPAAAIGLLDRLTVAMYRRPMVRVVVFLYLIFLHLAAFVF